MGSGARDSGSRDRPAVVIVVSGMQGAGKSTVAQALARRLPRAARIEPDALQAMIVSGGRWPEARAMSAEAAAQLRLRLHHACLLARSFVAAGFCAVIDDIVIGRRLDDLRAELAGERFLFVMLTPRLDVVRRREAGRGTRLWESWGWMDEEIRGATERVGLWLDTSEQTVAQTVEAILGRAWDEAWVEAPAAPSPSRTGSASGRSGASSPGSAGSRPG
jgi:predicted kinase